MVARGSQPTAPDIETASDEYAKRFSGAVGQWFLRVQAEATLNMLAEYPGASILDVGGGHGQTAEPLIKNGYDLTIFGSSESCQKQVRDFIRENRCDFDVGSIMNMPYPDDNFDVVLSYRMMAHVEDWGSFLSEITRVSKRSVIVDYPDLRSFNYFKEYLFDLKDKVESETRRYKCFRMSRVLSEFEEMRMSYSDHYRQFFWPMALHRWMGSVRTSVTAEQICRRIGLTSVWGAPVILKVDNSEYSS